MAIRRAIKIIMDNKDCNEDGEGIAGALLWHGWGLPSAGSTICAVYHLRGLPSVGSTICGVQPRGVYLRGVYPRGVTEKTIHGGKVTAVG